MAVSHFIKTGLVLLMLTAFMPFRAAASFWFDCKLRVDVTGFDVDMNTQAVQARFTILKSKLKGGHIDDKTCGFEAGQVIEVSSQDEADEFGRTIVTEITWPEGDLGEIKAGDTLLVRYKFFNDRPGDKTIWEIQARNPLLSLPF